MYNGSYCADDILDVVSGSDKGTPDRGVNPVEDKKKDSLTETTIVQNWVCDTLYATKNIEHLIIDTLITIKLIHVCIYLTIS